MTVERVIDLFGLEEERQLWEQREEIHDTPSLLSILAFSFQIGYN